MFDPTPRIHHTLSFDTSPTTTQRPTNTAGPAAAAAAVASYSPHVNHYRAGQEAPGPGIPPDSGQRVDQGRSPQPGT